jgi:glycosyltransferase involved in cell wall biosynthesis
MIEASVSLLQDEERRLAFSAAARAMAVEQYAAEKIIPQYEELYLRMLKKPVLPFEMTRGCGE